MSIFPSGLNLEACFPRWIAIRIYEITAQHRVDHHYDPRSFDYYCMTFVFVIWFFFFFFFNWSVIIYVKVQGSRPQVK